MDKSKILEVVKSMLLEWENGLYYSKDIYALDELNIDAGFCFWLSETNLNNDAFLVLKQLHFDLADKSIKFQDHRLWYNTPHDERKSKIKDFAYLLQPRIDHLKRTIARLEKELQNNSHV